MKIFNNITLLVALGVFASCHSKLEPDYTVGQADNAISLRAGISEGGEITRAAEDHHTTPGHVNFTSNTQLRLRVDGTWLGKGFSNNLVSKTTTATTGDATGNGNLHNKVDFTPTEQLYWDDYGSADPANIDAPKGTATAGTGGRNAGLTIYGVAVNGVATAPAVSDWTALAWTLDANQTGGFSQKDLLVSNNITSIADGTYKFDDFLGTSGNTASNLLEFTHAMTKITVNLTAGEGFPGWSSSTPTGGKFETEPSVLLKNFYYTGNVNIEAKTSIADTENTTDINMHLAEGGVNNHTATLNALVFPGNTFSATIADDAPNYTPTSTTDILELNADGNIYKVTAAQLVKAMNAVGTTGSVNGTLLQAKNYILNITVNKTDIEVTATIKDWENVPTEDALPKINVTATYGYTAGTLSSTAFTNNYDLFRSTTKATGYDEDNETAGINPAARFTSSAWDKTIFWPDHQTHYFFRGIYPQVGAVASGTTLPNEAVTTENGNDVVAVANATYTTATYPSDLAIAIPRNADGTFDETCKETGHTAQEGICATEGVINMNFEYAMSKVEVRLKSSATDKGHIALTKDNTTVEIIGGYSKARIKLSDGLHDTYDDATDKGDYTLSNLTDPETGFLVTTRDAIVPQEISDEVLFRITVTTDDKETVDTSDDETDVYECKVNLINVKNSSPATPVTEWVHGKHYIYELDVNKTAVTVTATLKNWVEVTASDIVWF